MSSNQERILKRFMKKSKADDEEYKNQTILLLSRKFMKKKAKAQKDYKKHEFLRYIVETAMKREKMDIDTDDYIDRKIQKKIKVLRTPSRPILVDQLKSKKPAVCYIPCQLPALREKEAAAKFKEVVKVDEEKDAAAKFKEVVKVDEDDDYDYEKEVMKKKMKISSSTVDKNKNKKNMVMKKKGPLPPLPLPNDEVCKLMQHKISEIGGTCPVWLAAKYMEKSDVNNLLGRLFIPKCCAKALLEFLTEKEKDFLIEEEEKKVKVGIPCRVVDQNGSRWELRLRYWPSVKQFTFIRNWNNVVNGFGLTEGNPGTIELWCFRLTEENLDLSFGLRITS